MPTYNVLEAKTQFSKLLDAVENGEDVVIARNGKPTARLVPVETKRRPVRLGLAKASLGSFDFLDSPEVAQEMKWAWEEFMNEDIMTGEDIVPLEELKARRAK